MKKLSFILLAVMLITAMFVSCKAEVIDDSNLVNVHFTTDDNAKGLNWSRPAFVSSDYYWTYSARKVGGGPATGEGTGEIGKDLAKEIGPFSQGAWEFTLYGYSDESKKTLVYEGTGSGVLAKNKDNSVNSIKVAVEAKKEGIGTIHVSKDIVLKDSNGVTYIPTGIIVKQVGSETADDEIGFDSTNGEDIEKESGYYAVTIRMVADVNGEKIVYASNTIYINVYGGQTTTIGGTLDEATTSTKFEAEDGTVSGNEEGEIETNGSATISVGVVPNKNAVAEDGEALKTTVVFEEGAFEAEQKTARLSVTAYPASVSKSFSINPSNGAVVSGIGLSLTVDGANVDTFNGKKATVATYVATGLVPGDVEVDGAAAAKEGLRLVYNGSEDSAMQPTIVSYNPKTGKLVFTTTHFSQYYVASTEIVAVNTTTNAAYTSLQDAIDAAQNGDVITVLKAIDPELTIVVEGKTITLDLNGKTISNSADLWCGNDWSLISVRENGNLTITGDGTLQAKENDCYPVDVQDGAILTIENGTFVGNIHAVYVKKGTANIEGGRYSVQQKYPEVVKADGFVLNLYDANRADGTAKMIVTGGEFKNFNPQDCWAEGAHTNFLPENGGYVATYDAYKGVFVVEKFEEKKVSDYASLVNALNSGKLAVLQNDISLSGSVRIGKDVMAALDLNGKTISMQTKDARAIVVDSGNLTVIGKEGAIESHGNAFRVINGGVLSISERGTYTSTNNSAIVAGDSDESTGGTVVIVSAEVKAQEAALLVLKDSKLVVYGGTFSAADNFVVGTNGTEGLGGYDITINGGTFNGKIVSSQFIACGVYAANDGIITLNGGVFNIENGVGIIARRGDLYVGENVKIKLTPGDTEAGKIGDSLVVVTTNSQIVRDEKSNYGSLKIKNKSIYTIVGVDGKEIQN